MRRYRLFLLTLASIVILLWHPQTTNAAIPASYVAPRSKQGVTDIHALPSRDEIDQRYQVLASRFKIGIRILNYFWAEHESSSTPSSADPVNCPTGYFMVPANQNEKGLKGFHKFRCINQSQADLFDMLISLDSKNGIQTAVAIWNSTEQYRYPGCLGFPWAGSTLKAGCVPRDDAMDDYQDFVTYLADRYSGNDSSKGKISHFIVWNEAAQGGWFDYSPIIPHSMILNQNQVSLWLDKYAEMVRKTADAVHRYIPEALVYASIDAIWGTNITLVDGGIPHIGSQTLIQGLWDRLGLDVDWSVAVHPYGNDPDANTISNNWMNFAGLQALLTLQTAQLKERGITEPFTYPQSRIFPSEQGWQRSIGVDKEAKNICLAHSYVYYYGPYIVGVTHNYFQENAADANNPASMGLIPNSAGFLFENDGGPTYQAYLSTTPDQWNQTNDHYCCQQYNLGCANHNYAPTGSFDNVSNSSCSISGWAYDQDSFSTSIPIHVYRDGPAGSGTLVGQYTANTPYRYINQAMGISGNHGFSLQFNPVNPNESAFFDNQPHSLYIYGIDTEDPVKNNNLLYQSPQTITCQPTPTPAPVPGDLNGDTHVDLADYNILVAGFGNPYTLADYNQLVAHFGT